MQNQKIVHSDKIRDARAKERFFMDDVYLNGYARHCGIHATGIYLSLCRHADKNQSCFPGTELMAEELKISSRSVFNGLSKLKEFNIIQVEKQKRNKIGSYLSSIYTLIDKAYWKPLKKFVDNSPCAIGADGRSAIGAGIGLQLVQVKEKHIIKDNYIIENEIFYYWNSKASLIKHRSFAKFKSCVETALKEYKAEEIKTAIDNYSLILSDPKRFWFNYTWSLDQFLARKNAIDKFLPENFKESTYLKTKSGKESKGAHVSEQWLSDRLGKIATLAMIKKVLNEIPQEQWSYVAAYLRKRWPGNGDKSFREAEREIMAEAREGQGRIKDLARGVGK